MRLRSAGLIVVAACLTAGASAPAALATLSLTTTAAPSFSYSLDNGDGTPSYDVPLTATDTSTGNSPGWNLTVTSTQLSTAGGTHSLSTTASKVTSVSTVCAGSCTKNPTNGITYPVTVPAGASPPTAVKFYDAAAKTGQGAFTVTPTIQVTVPQNSYAGTYTGTLTLAISNGP